MNWRQWRAHFERNQQRPLPDAIPAPPVTPEQRAALTRTLVHFQAGETGEGRIVGQVKRQRLARIDDDYRRALALFIKEEARHARILAMAVCGMNGTLLPSTWTRRLFVLGRGLSGVRTKLLVLTVAEVIGISFYGLLAGALPCCALRAALEQIADDERAHLDFHGDFFAALAPRGWRRMVLRLGWRLLMPPAGLAMLWDHRRTLRALGIPLRRAARCLALNAGQALRPPTSNRAAGALAARSVTS